MCKLRTVDLYSLLWYLCITATVIVDNLPLAVNSAGKTVHVLSSLSLIFLLLVELVRLKVWSTVFSNYSIYISENGACPMLHSATASSILDILHGKDRRFLEREGLLHNEASFGG